MPSLLSILGPLLLTSTLVSPRGEWTVQDKGARITIRDCGAELCGTLSWTDNGKYDAKHIGEPILIHMKPDGERWTGTVVDVRNGTRYLAHIALKSDNTLKLDGCVLGGLICSGEVWTRYR